MRKFFIFICGILIVSLNSTVSAGVWTDNFDGNNLSDGW